MAKGLHGESCAEAIRASIGPGERLSSGELYARTASNGSWTESTINQYLMSLVVNLPPARSHWPSDVPFLMLNQDGTYELYDPDRHPKVMG